MKGRSGAAQSLSGCIPKLVGFETLEPTLCLGLDIAWYGGSKNKPDSQHDCLVATLVGEGNEPKLKCIRLKLTNRDEHAEQIAQIIASCIDRYKTAKRVVLALDASLRTSQGNPQPPRIKNFRACERYFSQCRKRIDRMSGGSRGWHPILQPGVPLAPRVVALIDRLNSLDLGLKVWGETAAQDRIAIECFPAEAIWFMKRAGGYAHRDVSEVKAYKRQQGVSLSAANVRMLVEAVLLDGFDQGSLGIQHWPDLVNQMLEKMLRDSTWKQDGEYRGGKLLDDAVDSMICLATAISYAHRKAHVWQDSTNSEDGFIIGPGVFGVSD